MRHAAECSRPVPPRSTDRSTGSTLAGPSPAICLMLSGATTMTMLPDPTPPARPMDRRRARPSRRRRPGGIAALAGIVAAILIPAVAAAHPLGNFTINHYAGIRVEPDRILLDVVIDQAEIPTFQARLAFDTDGDGEVSDAEADVGRVTACERLGPSLTLALDGRPLPLHLAEAGLTFPPGRRRAVHDAARLRVRRGAGWIVPDGLAGHLRRRVVSRSARLARDRRPGVRCHRHRGPTASCGPRAPPRA